MKELDLKPPLGKFIIDNAEGVQGEDGVYYHYEEVIKLLKLYGTDKVKLTKEDIVKYLAGKYLGWYGEDNDISILKFSILLYFTVCADKTLLEYFNFEAVPYGTMDREVTNILKKSDYIDNHKIKYTPESLASVKFEKAVNELKRIDPNIINLSAFDLVTLNQYQPSWVFYMNKAKKDGRFSEDILREFLLNEETILAKHCYDLKPSRI